MKKVAGRLKLELSQYRDLEAFAQFGSDLDPDTQRTLARGERLVKTLNQNERSPLAGRGPGRGPIYAATNGYLDRDQRRPRRRVPSTASSSGCTPRPPTCSRRSPSGDWSDETQEALDDAVEEFAEDFGYDLDEEGQPLLDRGRQRDPGRPPPRRRRPTTTDDGRRRRDRGARGGGGRRDRLSHGPEGRQEPHRVGQEHPEDHARDGDGRRRAPAPRRAAHRGAAALRGGDPADDAPGRRGGRQRPEPADPQRARAERARSALLLVTGDRGLAGAFNSQIIRAGVRAAAEHEGEGRTIVWYAPGRRGVSSLTLPRPRVAGSYTGFTDRPAYANAREIAEDLMAAYVDGEVDRVEIFYNGYISPLTQEVHARDAAAAAAGDDPRGARRTTTRTRTRPRPGQHALVEYEPDPEEILQRLVPDYVEISIYRALLESTASEHGARMTAMRNASENAGEHHRGPHAAR